MNRYRALYEYSKPVDKTISRYKKSNASIINIERTLNMISNKKLGKSPLKKTFRKFHTFDK